MDYGFTCLGCSIVFSMALCSRYLMKIRYLKMRIFFKLGGKKQCNIYKHASKMGRYVYIYLVHLTGERVAYVGMCLCGCILFKGWVTLHFRSELDM